MNRGGGDENKPLEDWKRDYTCFPITSGLIAFKNDNNLIIAIDNVSETFDNGLFGAIMLGINPAVIQDYYSEFTNIEDLLNIKESDFIQNDWESIRSQAEFPYVNRNMLPENVTYNNFIDKIAEDYDIYTITNIGTKFSNSINLAKFVNKEDNNLILYTPFLMSEH